MIITRAFLLSLMALVLLSPLSGDLHAAPSNGQANGKFRKSKLTRDESEGLADKRRLLLTTGEDKAVDLDFEANVRTDAISTGNPQVVIPQLVRIGEKKQLVFKPLKAGETTVTVRDSDGNIRLIFNVRVTGSNLLRVASEVRDLLRDVEGIDIRIVGPKVVIEGEVLVPADYGRLLTVIQDKAYFDFVLNLTALSPLAMQVLAKKIQEDINTFAPDVKTRVVNGVIFLEGTVDSQDKFKRSKDLAELYLPEMRPGNALERDSSVQRIQGRQLIKSFIVIQEPAKKKEEKLVRVTVHFVELAKDYVNSFGFKWAPGFTTNPTIAIGASQDGSTTATGGATFSAVLSSLFPKLQSAQNAGYARILRTGTLIVRSGQPAKLAEELEIPISTTQSNGSIQAGTQKAGISIAMTPAILGKSEDIQMDLIIEQRNVAGRLPAAGAIINVHKVDTKIYVKSKESAAIAGIASSDVNTNFNKDDPSPGSFQGGQGGGQTDTLFNLLHSKKYEKKKNQFVIFVTPEIVENASEGTEDLKKNFRVKVK